MKKILVTGAGAVLGQGILRCLREEQDKYVIHTADPDYRSTGHWLGHKAHTTLMANDPAFISSIAKIIEQEGIDVVLIGTDSELPVFAEHRSELEKKYPVKILVSDQHVIGIANDKFLTSDFLKENGFDYPLSYMANDEKGVEHLKQLGRYPYIAKPIDGARSKGIVMINSQKDLDEVASYKNNLVVQEYITEDEGEFTTGCTVFDGKCMAVVTLRRDLRDGNTYRAYYNPGYEKYNPYIISIAEKLNIYGPSNFQFRVRNGKPVIFEINSRFSGTTPIRSYFGFNEVVAALDHILEGKAIDQPVLKSGMVMRAWSDIFVDDQQISSFVKDKQLESPRCTDHPFLRR